MAVDPSQFRMSIKFLHMDSGRFAEVFHRADTEKEMRSRIRAAMNAKTGLFIRDDFREETVYIGHTVLKQCVITMRKRRGAE